MNVVFEYKKMNFQHIQLSYFHFDALYYFINVHRTYLKNI